MIPKNIRINGLNYTIVNNDSLNDGENVLYGQVTYGKTLIQLNSSNQSEGYKKVTLWHEIFHAICNSTKLELGNQEEKVIDTFAFAINQILSDNKEEIEKMYYIDKDKCK